MNVLVTGGLGTIGNPLVIELRSRGHNVFLCDIPHHHDPQYFRCDVASYQQLDRIFSANEIDFVYHLAAEFGRWNGEDFYDTLWQTNAIGTKNLIRLQEKLKFKMIFFSSSEVYGDWDGVMKEDVMDKHEIRQLNDYAITKWIGEMQIMNSAAQFGTETVRVRLFNVYGPGEYYSPYRSAICQFIYRALHDLPYKVYLEHHRTSIISDDVVRTLANIMDNFKPGEVYNLGGEEYHDIKQVSDIILNYLGKKDDLVEYITTEPFTTKDKKVDISKAKKDLDHHYTIPLDEGIPRTVEWMKSVYTLGPNHPTKFVKY